MGFAIWSHKRRFPVFGGMERNPYRAEYSTLASQKVEGRGAAGGFSTGPRPAPGG